MNFYQIKLMVPLSYTVQAADIKHAESHGRQLVSTKTKQDDLVPYIHSVMELDKGAWPDVKPAKPPE